MALVPINIDTPCYLKASSAVLKVIIMTGFPLGTTSALLKVCKLSLPTALRCVRSLFLSMALGRAACISDPMQLYRHQPLVFPALELFRKYWEAKAAKWGYDKYLLRGVELWCNGLTRAMTILTVFSIVILQSFCEIVAGVQKRLCVPNSFNTLLIFGFSTKLIMDNEAFIIIADNKHSLL